MRNVRSPRLTLAVLAVAGLMLVAGGTALASNMAFKANIALVIRTATTGFQGTNWVALPYNNPYTSINAFCDQTGLVGAPGGAVPKQGNNAAFITVLNGATGGFSSFQCGFAPAALLKGQGIQIRQPAQVGAGDAAPPSSLIVVGSHDPTFAISLVAPDPTGANAQRGNYWFSVPYHTTATNLRQLCTTSGLGGQTGFVTTLDPSTGAFNSCICEFCPTTALTLGRHVQIRDAAAPLSFIPAHF